jgi:hypothetical protein
MKNPADTRGEFDRDLKSLFGRHLPAPCEFELSFAFRLTPEGDQH